MAENTKSAGIIVQARLTGKRFPNKMLAPINGIPVILHTLNRLKSLSLPIVIAIPINRSNAGLFWLLESKGYTVFKGYEEDVLTRFLECARTHKFDPIIRICGDSVLINKGEILRTLEKYEKHGNDWLAVGLGVQIFSLDALEWTHKNCSHIDLREHVWIPMEGSINYPEDIKIVEDYINGKKD